MRNHNYQIENEKLFFLQELNHNVALLGVGGRGVEIEFLLRNVTEIQW